MLRQTKSGWFLVAVLLSVVLHIGVAAWWLSRPVALAEQGGPQTITVELIAQPVAEPAAPPSPPVTASEPEVLPEGDIALQKKVLKNLPEKKPSEKKMSEKKPAPPRPSLVQEQPVMTAPPTPPAAVSQSSVSVTTTAARYDADYLNNPAPTYPSLSRRLGEEGRVVLRVQVSAEGRPLHIELKQSSGFERLDNAARKAAETWRFVPARQAGIPVPSWVEVPLQFSLKK